MALVTRTSLSFLKPQIRCYSNSTKIQNSLSLLKPLYRNRFGNNNRFNVKSYSTAEGENLSTSSSNSLMPTSSSSATISPPSTTGIIPEPILKPPYPVDTYSIVAILNKHFSRPLSENLTRAMIVLTQEKVREMDQQLLDRNKHELLQFINRTESQNLRNELRSYEKAETLAMKTQLQALERDLDQLSQKFRDDMSNLKTSLTIDFNEQKTKVREDFKSSEIKLAEVNYKLALGVSDLKGEIEAAKLDIVNYTVASLIGIVLFVGFGFKMLSEASEKPPQSPQAPIST